MPTDNKWIDKELLDDAFKAIDIFKEEGWEKGFDFLDEAKEKKEKPKQKIKVEVSKPKIKSDAAEKKSTSIFSKIKTLASKK